VDAFQRDMGVRSAIAALMTVLALPAGAGAATTFGSALQAPLAGGPPPASQCPAAPIPCDAWLVATAPSNAAAGAPSDGVLVRWRIRSTGQPRVVTPAVVRGNAVAALETRTVTTTGGATTPTVDDIAVRLPIRAGDLLGLRGSAPLPAAFAASGGMRVIGATQAAGELEVQGVIELDADGDGYGDETQDACPAQSDRQAEPCAAPVAPPPVVLATPPCVNSQRGDRDDNVLSGTAFGDRIVGLEGRDLIRAGDGDDCLFGGAGNDVLDGGAGNDQLSGGDGRDRLFGNAGNDRVAGGLKADDVSGGAGNDQLLPGSGRDRVRAGTGNDVVSARDGSRDVIDCGPGFDRVTADRRDVLHECERKSRR
jgi:Ca2+-binding RTX toxin-like protein